MFVFSLICAGLGATMALTLWLLEFPNPILWGTMIMFLTYIPYIGHAVGILIISIISIVTFDNYFQMILPPLCYLLFSALEGQVITPMLLGSRLDLNPLIVLINLFFWGWLWGISGFLISVPLLLCFKIILKYLPENYQKYYKLI
jgi:predicted PurR-regulated permease PerM